MNTKPIYKDTAGEQAIMALYDKVLAEWPVANRQFHVPTRHGETFVIASGRDGLPALLLLHGSGSNSATWAYDVIEYSRHFRVYAVDIPGEPGKSAPERFSWEGPAFAEWLEDVLDGLGLERAIAGGISLGGWAALKLAVSRPQRVGKLVLIAPSGICQPRLSFALRLIGLSLLGEWGRQRMKRLILNGAELGEDADRFLDLTARHFNFRMGAPPLFTDEELQRLTMPVLYLAGENDALLKSEESAERLRRLLPDVTAVVFGQGSHAMINLAPQVTAYLLEGIAPG